MMKTVLIMETFDGYPAGKKVSFVAGTEETVSDAFADLIIAKGHAREKVIEKPHAPVAKRAGAKPTEDSAHEDV